MGGRITVEVPEPAGEGSRCITLPPSSLINGLHTTRRVPPLAKVRLPNHRSGQEPGRNYQDVFNLLDSTSIAQIRAQLSLAEFILDSHMNHPYSLATSMISRLMVPRVFTNKKGFNNEESVKRLPCQWQKIRCPNIDWADSAMKQLVGRE